MKQGSKRRSFACITAILCMTKVDQKLDLRLQPIHLNRKAVGRSIQWNYVITSLNGVCHHMPGNDSGSHNVFCKVNPVQNYKALSRSSHCTFIQIYELEVGKFLLEYSRLSTMSPTIIYQPVAIVAWLKQLTKYNCYNFETYCQVNG